MPPHPTGHATYACRKLKYTPRMARDLRTGVGTLIAYGTFLLVGTLPAKGHPLTGESALAG